MARMHWRHWFFLITAIMAAAACVALGFWQLSRLRQRQALNHLIRSQSALPPLEISDADIPSELVAYRRVVASGTFDASRLIILPNRTYNGEPGSHLVTPLLLAPSGPAILIDRGWIPYEESISGDLPGLNPPGTVQVRGILRASQPEPGWSILADPQSSQTWRQSWRYLNIERLQPQFPYPILPVYLAQTDPLSGADLPRPDVALDLSDGSHLAYAIQWFSFATIAVIGGGIWLRRQLVKRPGSLTSNGEV